MTKLRTYYLVTNRPDLDIFRLINTSELYNSGGNVNTGGTLPKMSFGLMKEENSRFDLYLST